MLSLKALLANKALLGVAGAGAAVGVLALRRRSAAAAAAGGPSSYRLLGAPVPQTFMGAGAGPTPVPPPTSTTAPTVQGGDPLALALGQLPRPNWTATTTSINAPLTNTSVPWSPFVPSAAVSNIARGFSPASTPAQGSTRSWLSMSPARSVGG